MLLFLIGIHSGLPCSLFFLLRRFSFFFFKGEAHIFFTPPLFNSMIPEAPLPNEILGRRALYPATWIRTAVVFTDPLSTSTPFLFFFSSLFWHFMNVPPQTGISVAEVTPVSTPPSYSASLRLFFFLARVAFTPGGGVFL